jgi:3,4-dihydroxyphthalate decarboxylase
VVDAANLKALKGKVAAANRSVGAWYDALGLGHMIMSMGHVSARVPGKELFVVRGRASRRDWLVRTAERNLIVADFEGRKVGGSADVVPPGEIKLHSSLYRLRQDVDAVCHAHPHNAVVASVLGLVLKPMSNDGLQVFPVSLFENNALISTDGLGESLAAAMGKGSSCILRGHGVVTLAATPEQAVMSSVYLEEQARLNLLGRMAGGENYSGIPEEQVRSYLQHLAGATLGAKGAKLLERVDYANWGYLASKAQK